MVSVEQLTPHGPHPSSYHIIGALHPGDASLDVLGDLDSSYLLLQCVDSDKTPSKSIVLEDQGGGPDCL